MYAFGHVQTYNYKEIQFHHILFSISNIAESNDNDITFVNDNLLIQAEISDKEGE